MIDLIRNLRKLRCKDVCLRHTGRALIDRNSAVYPPQTHTKAGLKTVRQISGTGKKRCERYTSGSDCRHPNLLSLKWVLIHKWYCVQREILHVPPGRLSTEFCLGKDSLTIVFWGYSTQPGNILELYPKQEYFSILTYMIGTFID